jgi:putative ABC transport system permease protein
MRSKNDMGSFKEYMEENSAELKELTNAINYNYNVQLNVYTDDTEKIVQVNPGYYMTPLMGMAPGDKSGTISQGGVEFQTSGMSGMGMMSSGSEVWSEMLDNQELLQSQYDLVDGRWPASYDEIVVVVTAHDEIRDFSLYGMGLKDGSKISTIMQDVIAGKELETHSLEFTYGEILALRYKVLPNAALFQKQGNIWRDMSSDEAYMRGALNSALTLKVVGIIRPTPGAAATSITGTVGYMPSLTQYLIEKTYDSEIVKDQIAHSDVDVFSGKPFDSSDNTADFDLSQIPAEYQSMMTNMTDEQIKAMLEQYSPNSSATFDGNQIKLGIVDKSKPSTISLYPKDFESKDAIVAFIDKYNAERAAVDPDAQPLRFTDFIGILMSSISTVINAISYILIAFVSISLVVSSIMIGIITYVSVLERTKEIGILKSIGASKGDISRVFNAETLIVGLTAGLIGIGVTMLLCIPANAIIKALSDIPNVAQLPIAGAVVLVVLSCLLTLVAGLIPSKVAANKDPVLALRTE